MVPFVFLPLALSILAVDASPLYNTETRPTVTIDSGVVVGTTTSLPSSQTTVNQFLGVRFGAPPIRFSPPEPAEPWETPYDASEYRPACVQKFNYPEEIREKEIEWFDTPGPPAGESEDCLSLDIYTPARTSKEPKAVLFWLYGGGFSYGSASIPLYDGVSFVANQDVIVVIPNYRTNIFGFPGSPDLAATEQNLGWLDQRLALDWVQRNIAAFGGDPDRVTIFGESAGAGSVDALVVSPPDPVPFHAAIMQSGQASILIPGNASAVSWAALVEAVGCSSGDELQCIRDIPAPDLKDTIEKLSLAFSPTTDGGATWSDTSRLDRLVSTKENSSIARVPILIGSNADEGASYAIGLNDTEAFVRTLLPGDVPEEAVQFLLDAYAIGTPGIASQFDQVARINGEFSFNCPAKTYADDSASVDIPSWRYYFNASFPNTEIFEGAGAFHTSEINSVFGTYPSEGATEFQKEVSRAMQAAWANFAKDPQGGPGWEAVPKLGVFGGGVRVGDSDEGKSALVSIDPELADLRCALYTDLYDLATLGS